MRISRLAALVTALMSLFVMMSSTAGAVTWHNAGATAYTATGGAGTLSNASGDIACADVAVTGTSPAVTTGTSVATLTATFTACIALGLIPTHVHCRVTLTGVAQDPTGTATNLGDVHCVAVFTGLNPCTITGTVTGSYTNPVLPSTAGKLDIPHSSAGLTVGGSGCPMPGTGTLSAQQWTVTNGTGGTSGTLGPRFTRTP